MTPTLRIHHLKLCREQEILKGIDWEISPGEHWALLGPNGSGKTTLLHALTGYEPPSSGDIEIFGRTYGKSDWRQMRKQLGVVSPWVATHLQPRETAISVIMSGREAMVNYWGRPPEGLEEEAADILNRVHCSHLADRPWAYLSQGERGRVLIGRALMARHKILILDEACAGLDLVARDQFLSFLDGLAREKQAPTLIMVTHHIEEIIPAISHVLLLQEGRVAACGTKEKVLQEHILSQAFGTPLEISRHGEHYSAHLKNLGQKGSWFK